MNDAATLLARDLSLEIVRPRSLRPTRQTYEVMRRGQRIALKLYRSLDPTPPYPVAAQTSFLAALPRESGRLVVPRVLEHGFDARLGHWILFEWLDGKSHEALWHAERPPHDGGRGMELAWADRCVDLIADLPRIAQSDPRYSPAAMESVEVWSADLFARSIRVHARRAAVGERLSPQEANEVERHAGWMERAQDIGPLVASNTDFRFANLISMAGGRTGLVDWDGVRVSVREAAHCVAYLWIQMWNNPGWQNRLIACARERLGIRREEFRAVLIERCLVQMHTDRDRPSTREIQRGFLLSALDDGRYAALWGGDRA